MQQAIAQMIAMKHLAIVGVSDRKFGGTIYRALKARGYSVYPVHPARDSFEGDQCFHSLLDLPPVVKGAVVAISPESVASVVRHAIEGGLTHLWFQRGAGSMEAESAAHAAGLETVSGRCILMYAPPVTGGHRIHRFVWDLIGKS